MATVYSKELWPGRTAEDGIQRALKYTRVFEVRTDDPNDSGYVAGAEPSIPRNGDPHPDDPDRIMIRITADNDDADPTLWKVTCYYDSDFPPEQAREAGTYDPTTGDSVTGGAGGSGPAGGGGTPQDREDNPLDRPNTISVEWEDTQEIAEEDKDGNPIVASNGLPFDPPVMIERSRLVITISKNYAIGDPLIKLQNLADYNDGINAGTWAGFAEGTCKIKIQSMVYDLENNIPNARVTYRIRHRADGWKKRVADVGFYQLTSGDLFLIEVPEGTGQSSSQPWPLDGAGVILAPGSPLVFLEFDVYDLVDFSALGI